MIADTKTPSTATADSTAHVMIRGTWAVVISCLVVLVLDWGFSQLFVHIHDAGSADGAGAWHATLGADGPDDQLDDGGELQMRASHTVAADESSAAGPTAFPAPSGWAEHEIDDEL